MPTKKDLDKARLDNIVANAQKSKADREKGYREQALKLYPWICGRCRREFDHSTLRELTVHHKNHNHDDNPTDGSNWELLCLYCHDNEHQRYEEARNSSSNSTASNTQSGTFNPFANLGDLLNKDD